MVFKRSFEAFYIGFTPRTLKENKRDLWGAESFNESKKIWVKGINMNRSVRFHVRSSLFFSMEVLVLERVVVGVFIGIIGNKKSGCCTCTSFV